MRQTAAKTRIYMRHSSRMSPKSCGKDVAQEPRQSTSRVILTSSWGLLCAGDDDVVELNEVYGQLCWQGCENDQGGFEKLMWHENMKEFNCKATSTWSNCDDEREMAVTHRK